MDKKWQGFIAGILSAGCFRSLYQDAVGKEAYLKAAEHLWTTPWVSIPLAVAGLVVALVVMTPDPRKGGRKDADER